MKDLMQYDEIYRLPIVVTKEYLELEKEYFEFYNDEYWRKYKEKNAKKKIQKGQGNSSERYY
jgi:hypothetical protein